MKKYIYELLGAVAEERKWEIEQQLPFYLRDGNEYIVLTFGEAQWLAVRVKAERFNLSAFLRQKDKLKEYWTGNILVCFDRLTSYQRKALILEKISFIVPGSQLYMPECGIALQERMPALRKSQSCLSAAAQRLLLYMLYQKSNAPQKKVELSKALDISTMNITRAVQVLEALHLVQVEKVGRCDYVSLVCEGQQLYYKAKPYLIDPVQKKMHVRSEKDFFGLPLAGESALAEMSMLNPPKVPCYAIDKVKLNELEQIEIVDPAWYSGTDCIELELWKYDPRILAKDGIVDRISLEASLAKMDDERVQIELEKIMEDYEW